MNKDQIFFFTMLILTVMLCLLNMTGLTMHIVLAVIALIALIVFTIINRKNWESKGFEITLRVMFGIAFVSGIVMVYVPGVRILQLLHEGCAVAFGLMLVFKYGGKLRSR